MALCVHVTSPQFVMSGTDGAMLLDESTRIGTKETLKITQKNHGSTQETSAEAERHDCHKQQQEEPPPRRT